MKQFGSFYFFASLRLCVKQFICSIFLVFALLRETIWFVLSLCVFAPLRETICWFYFFAP